MLARCYRCQEYEPGKVNPRIQCYRCQGYGHLASQCPSQTKTLFVEIPIEDIEREDDGEVAMHQQDDDSDAVTPRFPKYVETGSRRESGTYIREENTPRIHAKPKVP